MEENYTHAYKLLIIGNSGVGKTCLIHRLVRGEMRPTTLPTIGVEFSSLNHTIGNDNIKAQIWDTSGQERFRAICSAHFRRAVGAIIVFDLTNSGSFDAVESWRNNVVEQAGMYKKRVLN